MLARKGIFTTPSIMQPYVSAVRAPARVTCIASLLHIFFQDRKRSQKAIYITFEEKRQLFVILIVHVYYTIFRIQISSYFVKNIIFSKYYAASDGKTQDVFPSEVLYSAFFIKGKHGNIFGFSMSYDRSAYFFSKYL